MLAINPLTPDFKVLSHCAVYTSQRRLFEGLVHLVLK